MKFEHEEIFVWRLSAEEDATVVEALERYIAAFDATDAARTLAQLLLDARGARTMPVHLPVNIPHAQPTVAPPTALNVPPELTPEQRAAAKAEADRFQAIWGTVVPAAHEGADR